jgi:hypothetical protein
VLTGRSSFYLEGDDRRGYEVMSAPIVAAPSPVGTPKPLFEFQAQAPFRRQTTSSTPHSADGQRFLVNVYAPAAQPSLEVLLNWGGRRPTGKEPSPCPSARPTVGARLTSPPL